MLFACGVQGAAQSLSGETVRAEKNKRMGKVKEGNDAGVQKEDEDVGCKEIGGINDSST